MIYRRRFEMGTEGSEMHTPIKLDCQIDNNPFNCKMGHEIIRSPSAACLTPPTNSFPPLTSDRKYR